METFTLDFEAAYRKLQSLGAARDREILRIDMTAIEAPPMPSNLPASFAKSQKV